MKNHILLLFVTGIISSYCHATPPAPPPTGRVVQGNNAFAAELYAKLAAQQKGNLFFSPGSIHTALAMTYTGADGNTAKQMAAILHLDQPAAQIADAYGELLRELKIPNQERPDTSSGYELVMANALWGQMGYEFKPAFIHQLEKSYMAKFEKLVFAQSDHAAKTINAWVQTSDLS